MNRRVVTPKTIREGKTDLKVSTNVFPRGRPASKSFSQGRLRTVAQVDDLKSAQDTSTNKGKSRFAAIPVKPLMEEGEGKSFWRRLRLMSDKTKE